MITFEDILPTLNELFIEKLPLYIEEINKIKNDGIIIKPFENNSLFENYHKSPYFIIKLKESKFTEKDRIIENTIFNIIFEITIMNDKKDNIIKICRYKQAIERMLNDTTNLELTIYRIVDNCLFIRIII